VSVPDLPGVLSADDIRTTVASIAAEQEATGAIPWYTGGQLDPWDHVEAAMALDVGGETERAEAAYDWLRRTQRADGSWASRYEKGVVADATAETNHAAYLAVGCWHHFLCTGDEAFLARTGRVRHYFFNPSLHAPRPCDAAYRIRLPGTTVRPVTSTFGIPAAAFTQTVVEPGSRSTPKSVAA
jgi:hypothetical protein